MGVHQGTKFTPTHNVQNQVDSRSVPGNTITDVPSCTGSFCFSLEHLKLGGWKAGSILMLYIWRSKKDVVMTTKEKGIYPTIQYYYPDRVFIKELWTGKRACSTRTWQNKNKKEKNGAIPHASHIQKCLHSNLVWYGYITHLACVVCGSLNLAYPVGWFEFCPAILCTCSACPLPRL